MSTSKLWGIPGGRACKTWPDWHWCKGIQEINEFIAVNSMSVEKVLVLGRSVFLMFVNVMNVGFIIFCNTMVILNYTNV